MKTCVHECLNRIIFSITIVLLCVNIQQTSAQTITIKGTIYSTEDSTTIPFATIQIHDSTGNQLGGSVSDFDGNFIVILTSPASGYMHASVNFICHYEVVVDSLRCENQELNMYIQPVPCPEKTQADCPSYNDECDVVPIVYMTMFDKPSKKVLRDNEKGLIYIKQRSKGGSECCPNEWYCKTHHVEF